MQVQYVRDKQAKDVTLTVADRSALFPSAHETADEQPGQNEEPSAFGLHVEEFTPDIARKLGMTKVTGVVVTEVDPASFGEDIDFARGDVITEMNHVPITSLADYRPR